MVVPMASDESHGSIKLLEQQSRQRDGIEESHADLNADTCIVQHPNGGGIDELMEQGNNGHQKQQPPLSAVRPRRRSLLGNSQQQQPRARRRSLEIADIESFDDAAACENETVKYEQSFDTIEYYTDDDDDEDDAPFENNLTGFNTVLEYDEETLDYDEETIENFEKSIDTLEYEEEMNKKLATLEYQEAALVEEDVFGYTPDAKGSESAVDVEACASLLNESETAPLSLQTSNFGSQEVLADELGDQENLIPLVLTSPSLPPHLSGEPAPEQQEPPPACFQPSVFASSRATGTSSFVSIEDDQEGITLEAMDSDPPFQFDPSVITCSSPGADTSIVSSEDDTIEDAHEIIREGIDSYEDDSDADIHEVIREESDPYLQFDPSDIAGGGNPRTKLVSNETVNDVDTQDNTCEDTGESQQPVPSRGKRIRKMFGSLIRRPSKLHIDQSEDGVGSPVRTADENGQDQSCSNNLHAAAKLKDLEEDNKEGSSQITSPSPLSSLGLTRQREPAMSPEQPLLVASKPNEGSLEQAFQCDAVTPPSSPSSNRANRFKGIFKSLSSKALLPRRETKSASIENVESPILPLQKNTARKELDLGSPRPDQQEFQSDDEAPPSPSNKANRFHEIFQGLMMNSRKQEFENSKQVDCSMSPLQKDEVLTSTLPAPPLSISKSTKHLPDDEQETTKERLPVDEPQCQPTTGKKVSFQLPPNHRESPSPGRSRRRPGSPPRRKTANRPGSPSRERQNGTSAVVNGVRPCSPENGSRHNNSAPRERQNGASVVRKGPRHSDSPRQRQNSVKPVGNGVINDGGKDPVRWDLRVRFGSPAWEMYNKPLRHDDCVVVPDFFGSTNDWSVYYKLLLEIRQLQDQNISAGGSNLIQCPTDVGKHLVCTTPMKCKTFREVCKKVCTYFDIKLETVQFTLNWYRDSTDMQKPRHDEEAYESDQPSIRNITVGISFGAERELSLEKHVPYNGKEKLDRNVTWSGRDKLAARISIPQCNNCVCTIGRDVNIRFKNGLVQQGGENGSTRGGEGGGTIAIIIWGQVQNVKEEKESPAQLKRDPIPLSSQPTEGKRV